MSWRRVMMTVGAAALAGFVYWISTHTYWDDLEVPMPPRGEARTNPTYAAQRFVEALGAHATRDRMLAVPAPTSVIALSAWNWSLSPARRDALERWVEAGGRLLVDGSVTTDQAFDRWSGIGYDYRESARDEAKKDEPCHRFHQQRPGNPSGVAEEDHWLCDFDDAFFLTTTRPVDWALTDATLGMQAVRVRVGRGSVTSVNGDPFRYRKLFDGDHGWLLVNAARLRTGDDVHFLSEADYPPLLALMWQRGEPVVVLTLVVVALLLWRGAVRLGPLAAPTATARRSLAEQIRGTGRFTLHHGGGDSLHAACVRALDEAARRRVAGYARLSANTRADEVARLTGLEPNALAAAIYHPRTRRSHELGGTIALLETARRRLITKARLPHGT